MITQRLCRGAKLLNLELHWGTAEAREWQFRFQKKPLLWLT